MSIFERLRGHIDAGMNKTILSDENGEYGAKQLWDVSGRVYRYLAEKGIGAEDIVVIHMPRGAEAIMAAAGVLRAGAALTIHEDWYSSEQLDQVKNDPSCKLVIDSEIFERIMSMEALDGWKVPGMHDLAYIIYTTGTSGERKGVMHEYGTIDRFIKQNYNITYGRELDIWRTSLVISLHSAVLDIVYLINFLSYLDIVPNETLSDREALHRRIAEKRINYMVVSPVMVEKYALCTAPSLLYLNMGFEPITDMYSSAVQLTNSYGMTESGGKLSEFFIDRPYGLTPIGKPFYQGEMFLLDESGAQVPDGEIGEICFKNHYCRGYFRNPEASSAQFRDGLFHTRDLGKVLPDGNWLMLGRMIDSLLVPQGIIVALEIETLIRRVMEYKNIYVKVFPSRPGTNTPDTPVICVYSDRVIDLPELQNRLRTLLPEYELPTDFQLVKAFNYRNGKVIRLELRNPYEQ